MTGQARGPGRTLLGRATVLAVATGLACAVVAASTRGTAGLSGAVAGLGLVLAFLLLGQVPVAVAARGRSWTGAALLLLLYAGRVLLLVLAYTIVVGEDTGLDRRSLGLTVIGSALGWTAGAVWSAQRWRPYVVDPDQQG